MNCWTALLQSKCAPSNYSDITPPSNFSDIPPLHPSEHPPAARQLSILLSVLYYLKTHIPILQTTKGGNTT